MSSRGKGLVKPHHHTICGRCESENVDWIAALLARVSCRVISSTGRVKWHRGQGSSDVCLWSDPCWMCIFVELREKERDQRLQEAKTKAGNHTTESTSSQSATSADGSAVSRVTKTQRLVQSSKELEIASGGSGCLWARLTDSRSYRSPLCFYSASLQAQERLVSPASLFA